MCLFYRQSCCIINNIGGFPLYLLEITIYNPVI